MGWKKAKQLFLYLIWLGLLRPGIHLNWMNSMLLRAFNTFGLDLRSCKGVWTGNCFYNDRCFQVCPQLKASSTQQSSSLQSSELKQDSRRLQKPAALLLGLAECQWCQLCLWCQKPGGLRQLLRLLQHGDAGGEDQDPDQQHPHPRVLHPGRRLLLQAVPGMRGGLPLPRGWALC